MRVEPPMGDSKIPRNNTRPPRGYEHSIHSIAASAPPSPSDILPTHQWWSNAQSASTDDYSLNSSITSLPAHHKSSPAQHDYSSNRTLGIDQRDRFYSHLGATLRSQALAISPSERIHFACTALLQFLSASLKPDSAPTYKAPLSLGEQVMRKRDLLANGDVARTPTAVRRGDSAVAATADAPVVQPDDKLDRQLYIQEQSTYEGLLTSDHYMHLDQGIHASMKVSGTPYMIHDTKSVMRFSFSNSEPTFERQALLSQWSPSYIEIGGASGVPGERGPEQPAAEREVYLIKLPDLVISNFLNPESRLQVYWSGDAHVVCPKNGFSATIAFQRSLPAQTPLHALLGRVHTDTNEHIATFAGTLDGRVEMWNESQSSSGNVCIHDDLSFMRTRPAVTSSSYITASMCLFKPSTMLLRSLWACITDSVHTCRERKQPLTLLLHKVVQQQTHDVLKKKEQCAETRHEDQDYGLRWLPHEYDASRHTSRGRDPGDDTEAEIKMEYELSVVVADMRPPGEAPRVPPIGPEHRPSIESIMEEQKQKERLIS